MRKKDEHQEEFGGLTLEKLSSLPRSKLQISTIQSWLKTRHAKTVKKRYLFVPEQIKRQLEIKNIFQNFDKDGSDALDAREMQQMFKKNGFNITVEEMKQLFAIVDKDNDSIYTILKRDALSWQEFKQTAFNKQVDEVFTKFMRRIRTEKSSSDLPFIPMTFERMISFLSFCTSREELSSQIMDETAGPWEKFKKIQELFALTKEYSTNKQKLQQSSNTIQEKTEESPDTVISKNQKLMSKIKKFSVGFPLDDQLEARQLHFNRRKEQRIQHKSQDNESGKHTSPDLKRSLFTQSTTDIYFPQKRTIINKKQKEIEQLKAQVSKLSYVKTAKDKFSIDLTNDDQRSSAFVMKTETQTPTQRITEYFTQGLKQCLTKSLPKIKEQESEDMRVNRNKKFKKFFTSRTTSNQIKAKESIQTEKSPYNTNIPQDIIDRIKDFTFKSPQISSNPHKKNSLLVTASESFKRSFYDSQKQSQGSHHRTQSNRELTSLRTAITIGFRRDMNPSWTLNTRASTNTKDFLIK